MGENPQDNLQVIPPTSQELLWLRWIKYILLAVLCNGALVALSVAYLKKTPPTYTSEALIHVASGGSGVSVNLPSIGQATTSSGTSFGSHSDPKENFKLMATSPTILQTAANDLEVTKSEFGKPMIELINNTTLMEFSAKANTPKEAQKKVWAVYNALYNRLSKLREEELAQKNQYVEDTLREYQITLTKAQKKLSDYKASSGFTSGDQVKKLIENLAKIQIDYVETSVLNRQVSDRRQQLSENLNLSPEEAANALVLGTDQEFQKILDQFTAANSALINVRAIRGVNYPDVVKARKEREENLKALLTRGGLLLKKPTDKLALDFLILDNSNGSGDKRANLFSQLIDLHSEQVGIAGKLNQLRKEILGLNNQLSVLTQKEAIFETLDRDLQIAQAVFASTLTKLDLSQSDIFASFPMIQMIEEPGLAKTPATPKPGLVMAGTAVGCIFISIGLTILWWREPLIFVTRKVLTKIVE